MRFLGKHVLIAVAASALLVLAVPVVAQTPSLGEIAKKEQDRRKGAKQPAKVYTNDDLKGGGLPSAPPVDRHAHGGSGTCGSGRRAAGAGDDAPKDAKPAAAKDAPASGATTRRTKKRGCPDHEARDELRRNEVFAEALQSRINALTDRLRRARQSRSSARRSPTSARRRWPRSSA